MKDFVINISYSWGETQDPIKISALNEYGAFMQMMDLATKEAKASMEMNYCFAPTNPTTACFDICNSRITLHYGYDNEECYYELKEANTDTDDLLDDLLMEQREQM